MSELFVIGIKKEPPKAELQEKIKKVFLESTNDLEWLKEGDLVLLKPAVNSPDPYPATTSPDSVRVVHDALKERGARVIVGDQAGIEHVVCGPGGVAKGDSEKCFIRTGMKENLDIGFKAFEREGWDEGFYKVQAPSWPKGFYVTRWVEEADHIISLPRLSTHAQAGITLGFKNMVGILREDSRMVFHAEGPFNRAFKIYSKKGKIENDYPNDDLFFEKMTEISLAVKEKLRCTLVVGTKAQVTFGPDARVMSYFKSRVAEPDTGLIFASCDQVSSEVFGLAVLKHLYSKLSYNEKLLQKLLIALNGKIKELDKEDVWENPFIRHALEVGLGEWDININYEDVPKDLKIALNKIFERR